MARMGRPKTAAADYERLAVRLPPELVEQIRAQAASEERPLNTEVVQLVRLGLAAKRQAHPHPAPVPR